MGRKLIEHKLDRGNLEQEWIQSYPELCARWARWTADRVEDYVVSGYEILGIIHVQDSPTCGLDHVDTFPQVHFDLLASGVSWDHLDHDELIGKLETPEEMAARGANGTGAFADVLRDELVRRGIDVRWLGYVPSKPMREQSEEILRRLSLKA